MAEKLVELIHSFENKYNSIVPDKQGLADHLVANGVTVSEGAMPAADTVIIPDKELLKAIKLLIKQYERSKNSEYVYNPVAHALYHTWKQVDEG